MKAKTFENLIRKIVREEIDYALRREIKSLKEDLRDELKPTIIEQSQPSITEQPVYKKKISNGSKKTLKEKIMGSPSPKMNYKKHNFIAGNNTLNDLLNETARGDTNTVVANQPPVSLSQPFASGAPLPVDTTGMPDPVAKAVTRDYSGLMKAINEKKKR